jgi:hypothetical protein
VPIDIVYLSWNRLAFTEISFRALLANTDWGLVHRLYVYDDASKDGTREWLDGAVRACPADYKVVHAGWRSPVSVMNHYVGEHRSVVVPKFAKIDNDIAVPPGWLNAMDDLIESDPAIELLGMEAGMTCVAGRDGAAWDGVYRFEPSTHIGGVGLMRLRAFEKRKRIPALGRFGFTKWQTDHDDLVRGWITPDLACPQLDRIPFEPFLSLSADYVERGWQRPWPKLDAAMGAWAWEHLQLEEEA